MYGICDNIPYINNRKENMQNKIEQSIIKSMDMHITTSNNMMKLGKVVEVNTNNLNLLATKIMKLEQRIRELEKRNNGQR